MSGHARGFALVAVVLGAIGCGGSADPGPAVPLEAGEECTGDPQCASGHCDSGYCCTTGTCCSTASECPSSFSSGSQCGIPGPTTDCQGTRRDATCEAFMCGTRVVDDDSGCKSDPNDGVPDHVRDCGGYGSIACSGTPAQVAPVCATTCGGPSECDAGFTCSGGHCIPQAGTGGSCTGTGQGTCAANLKCQNGVCCAAGTAACCTVAQQATQCGTCMQCGSDSRCTSTPSGQTDARCPTGTCHPGTCNGNGSCFVGGSCTGGLCGSTTCTSSGACGCQCSMGGPNGTTLTACPGGTIYYPCTTGQSTSGYLTFRCSATCGISPDNTTCH